MKKLTLVLSFLLCTKTFSSSLEYGRIVGAEEVVQAKAVVSSSAGPSKLKFKKAAKIDISSIREYTKSKTELNKAEFKELQGLINNLNSNLSHAGVSPSANKYTMPKKEKRITKEGNWGKRDFSLIDDHNWALKTGSKLWFPNSKKFENSCCGSCTKADMSMTLAFGTAGIYPMFTLVSMISAGITHGAIWTISLPLRPKYNFAKKVTFYTLNKAALSNYLSTAEIFLEDDETDENRA